MPKCPVCKSKRHAIAFCQDHDGYDSIKCHVRGRIINNEKNTKFNVCLDCGTVYIFDKDLERLRKAWDYYDKRNGSEKG